MIAIAYASAIIFVVIAPTIAPFGWKVFGCVAAVIALYLVVGEIFLSRRTGKTQ